MNPLEMIKDGVLRQDWQLVIDGYGLMTGCQLSIEGEPPVEAPKASKKPRKPAKSKTKAPPKPKRSRAKRKPPEEDYEERGEELVYEDDDFIPEPPKRSRKKATEAIEEGGSGKTFAQTVPWRPQPISKNKFKDDLRADRSLLQTPAQKRNKVEKVKRKPFRKIQINCYSCGRLYKVNPFFIYDNAYRCDSCCKG